jgi:superfamily II DNA or RNA helicase
MTLEVLTKDRRCAWFSPSSEFWNIWRSDREGVKGLNFYPVKTEHGWRVKWHAEEYEIRELLAAQGNGKTSPALEENAAEETFLPLPECAVQPLDYQIAPIKRLCEILKARRSAIDASDTGAGKTYVAAFVAKMMGLRPLVICMKSAIGSWKKALLGVGYASEEIFVNNYEQWTRGNCFKYYDLWKFKGTSKNIAIVDEVHKCRNPKTKNARMLTKIRRSDAYLLMLSATAFETPDKAVTIGCALGLCEDSWKGKREWLVEHGCFPSRFGSNSLEFCGNRKYLIRMHSEVFPKCGVRVRIKDIPGFPESLCMVDPITLDDQATRKLEISLQNIRSLAKQLENVSGGDREERARTMADMQRERMEVERLKLPVMCELADGLVEEGKSVAMFLNFTASMGEMKKRYGPEAVYVHGGQKIEERERAMALFQDDKVPLIILNVEAGGTSISLHDVRGERQRYSIISPNWSAITFKQVLGRIHRSGGKSPAIQRIVLVDGTIEGEIANKLHRKLKNIAAVNDAGLEDGDLL